MNAARSCSPRTRPSASGAACSAMTCSPRPSWTGCCTTATSSPSTGPAIGSRTASSPWTEVVPWSDPCLPYYRHISPYLNRHQPLTPDSCDRLAHMGVDLHPQGEPDAALAQVPGQLAAPSGAVASNQHRPLGGGELG